MRARSYAIALIGAAFGLFLAVVIMNIVIDPQAVLGTGLIGRSTNVNDRYQKFLAYESSSSKFDGLLFGSSRAPAIPRDLLSRHMGGVNFADFSVAFGLISDHLPVLQYVLREKAARGERLRAVFLLLDADLFGRTPATDRNIQSYMPPEITGESRGRFVWRYLTAIQFKAWRADIGRALAAMPAQAAHAAERGTPGAPPREPAADRERARSALPQSARERITARPSFITQITALEKFVAICRQHKVRLVVALSPLRRDNAAKFETDGLASAAKDIAGIVPVWDFGIPDWLSDRPDLWRDESHYTSDVGRMMIERIFGIEPTLAPRDFGTLRSVASPNPDPRLRIGSD
jgi:hypothetical protein